MQYLIVRPPSVQCELLLILLSKIFVFEGYCCFVKDPCLFSLELFCDLTHSLNVDQSKLRHYYDCSSDWAGASTLREVLLSPSSQIKRFHTMVSRVYLTKHACGVVTALISRHDSEPRIT